MTPCSCEQIEMRRATFDILPLRRLLPLTEPTVLARPAGVVMLRRPNCDDRGFTFTEAVDALLSVRPLPPGIARECFLDSPPLAEGLRPSPAPGGASDAPDRDDARRARTLASAMPATVIAGPKDDRGTTLKPEALPGLGDGERDDMMSVDPT